jgi:RND family efflux transporter MFP subunit
MLAFAVALAACGQEPESAAPEVRPVRTVTVEKRAAGVPVVLTGRVEAEDEARLAFRLSGRIVERRVNTGDKVEAGQLIARLDNQDQLNALRAAEANLAAAEGQAAEAENEYQRQRQLEERGFAARAVYERARQMRQTTRSQVEAAQAQVRFAQDQASFTELHADAEGVVTEVGAEPGEVVQAGQLVVRLAREDGRDAVFDVPAQVIRSAPADPEIQVFLAEDPRIEAVGRVREVGAQADPVTRTFEVRWAFPTRRRRCGWEPPSPGGWRSTRARSSACPPPLSPARATSRRSGWSSPRPRPWPCGPSTCSASSPPTS